MKDLTAIRGRHYIASLIAEGEHTTQDFKYAITDARKIARTLSAFANTEGGRLLIGVKDNGVIAGVRSEEDIYMVEAAAESFCTPSPEVRFTMFRTDPGVNVLRAEVAPSAQRPVRVREENGKQRAYVRIHDENIAAHPLMVRSWQRAQSSSEGISIYSAETMASLVDWLSQNGPGRPEDPGRALHLRSAVAEDIITDALRMDLIRMIYLDGEFLLDINRS